MAFGDVDRFAASPSSNPNGVGGDANTIWHNDYIADLIYELSTTDFSVDRSAGNPGFEGWGIGGDADTIWHCDEFPSDKIYELSTTDLSEVRAAASPNTHPSGIGGDASTIWHCDRAPDLIYELFTTDFSVDRSANSPNIFPQGVGGDANTVWNCDTTSTDKIYELSTTDFSVDRSANSPDTSLKGIGGDANTIWSCTGEDKIYELDAAPPVSAPTVTTQAITDIAATTATGNGNITDTGGENPHTRGICWDTSPTPTTADSKSEDNGAGSYSTGAFSKGLTSLTPGQHYFVRAYAINSEGTSYGGEVEFTTVIAVQAVGDGAVAIAGSLSSMLQFAQAVGSGSIAIAGTLGRVIKLSVGAGSIAIAGALTASRTFFQAVGDGSVAIAGSLGLKFKIAVGDGAIAIAGTLIAISEWIALTLRALRGGRGLALTLQHRRFGKLGNQGYPYTYPFNYYIDTVKALTLKARSFALTLIRRTK